MSYTKINEEEEKCEECGRVDHPAYMCWRVGHLQKEKDKRMTNKIRVHHYFDTIENTFTFQTIIKICESAIEAESSGEWERLELVSSEDNRGTWHIYGMRWETDKEYEKRMKELEKTKEFKKKMKQVQEERDKKEYERLKKKFGDK